jgi:hypothetical protein
LLSVALIFLSGSGSGLVVLGMASIFALIILNFVYNISPSVFICRPTLTLLFFPGRSLLRYFLAFIFGSFFLSYISQIVNSSFSRRLGENWLQFQSEWFLSLDPEDAVLFINSQYMSLSQILFGHGMGGFARYTLSIPDNFFYFPLYFTSPFSRSILIEMFYDLGSVLLFVLACFIVPKFIAWFARSRQVWQGGGDMALISIFSLVALFITLAVRVDDYIFFSSLSLVIASPSLSSACVQGRSPFVAGLARIHLGHVIQ